jgi:multiple sugar transport system substrate-binding protein
MNQRGSSPDDRKRLQDEAIVDFSQRRINRRDFMFKMTAAGVGVVAAGRVANALAAPVPTVSRSRWSKAPDATVTFIKGPHHPDDQKFWDQLKKDFEASHPGITLNPTFFDWATMDAQLTAGYAGTPADVVYLVDLVLPKFVAANQVADISTYVNDPAYATEKAGIAPFTWDVTNFGGKTMGVGTLGAAFGIFYNVDMLTAAGITEFPKTRDALVEAGQKLTKDGVWGFQFRDTFPNYAHWDWMPYVHNDGGDVLSSDLKSQNLDPAAAAATQWLSDTRLVSKIAPPAGTYDWDTEKALFAAGRIAILHDEFPQAAVWELDPKGKVPFKLDVAQAPATAAGGKQTTMGNFGYATISEKSQVKDAAWEFTKWWASKDVINPYAAEIGLQGVRVDSAPAYTSTLLQKVQKEFVPSVQGVQLDVNYYQMLTNAWPEIEKAYRGEQSGADAVKNAGAAVTALIAK